MLVEAGDSPGGFLYSDGHDQVAFESLLRHDATDAGLLAGEVSRIAATGPICMRAPKVIGSRAPGRFVPYGFDDWGRSVSANGDSAPFRLQDALVQIEKVNGFAREWREKNRRQTGELESLGGGCALVKREVLQKLGLFPTRTSLGAFDLEGLGQRIRHAGFRLACCRELFIHNFGSRGVG